MPKQNFRQAKIYAIKSYKTDKVYIGSTTERLISNRMKGHRSTYKSYLKGKSNYVTSFEILKYGDAYIELIKNCPCDDINELRAFEGAEIRATNCVNRYIAGRTDKEYREDNKERISMRDKAYKAANKEQIKAYQEAHYQANKPRIAAQMKAYHHANKDKFVCHECEYSCNQKSNLTKHKKTKKHLKMVEFLIDLFGPNYNDAE